MKNGTPILWRRLIRVPVRMLLILLMICAGLFSGKVARSQCTLPGYNQATLNWDILDYLITGSVAGISYPYTNDNYMTNALAYTQNFAFGPNNRLTIAVSSTNVVLGGEVATHTGELANYTGDDVMFTGDNVTTRTITLTFENAVENPNFAIYDIERSQQLTISAVNDLGVATLVNAATQGGSILTVGVTGLPNRTITANTSTSSNSSNAGSATITVPGLVRSITIAITAAGTDSREIYLSDIRACVNGTFPLNYYAVAQPFTSQPGYVLHAFNRSVYYVNPANGFTRLLFTDPGGSGIPGGNINSLAYDPYNRYIYYVFSLTNSGNIGNATMMRRYDVNTGTFTTMVTSLENIGLPTTDDYGTESGSAAFYNGSYYIGVETSANSRNSGREAVIWRIDFNGTGFPSRCSQVFAQSIDSAGLLLHDWSDFVIHDGILYNFDAAENDVQEPDECGGPSNCPDYTPANRNQSDIYHVDMMTGDYVRYRKPGLNSVPIWYPGQPAINYAGQVVQMYANAGSPTFAGAMPGSMPYITMYNGNGTIGSPNFMFSAPNFSGNPSLGDAAEAFKPRSDFGDAPLSYDNNPMAPATHEHDPLLRLGSTRNIEWSRTSSALADAEGGEEDGIGLAPTLFTDASMSYTINNISVFNNTGAAAVLIAWLDYNLDGQFQASEGRAVNIPNSASPQTTSVTWNNIWVPITSDVRTFLRFRIARAIDGMTVNNMNGWIAHGEVEDYPVPLGAPLPKDIQSFDAKKKNNVAVDVQWSINVQQPVRSYEILRSTDDNNWTTISTVTPRDGMGVQNYAYTDLHPAPGKSHYRVRVVYVAEGANKLSETRVVQFNNNVFVRVLPNPAHEQAEIQVNATGKGDVIVRVYDRVGRMVIDLKQSVETGMNSVQLKNLNKLADGVYTIRTLVNGRTTSNQLVIKNQ